MFHHKDWVMDRQTSLRAEAAAQNLLRLFREAHPDWRDDRTPLDEVAAWLGVTIATFHPDDYPRGTYGFVDPDEEEPLIWLCRDLSESLRRFTLAHELGHVLLHCQIGDAFLTNLPTLSTLLAMQQMPALSPNDPCRENDIQEDLTAQLDEEA